ncbi:T9SS type A sorting domain-containing protein [uncultured Draconibacterium sp.]|uniref:T9SS type A sorting domain-containing protein n=1 Tax=uncultured Draconibacterium sp. TaxID=1573823 RepID=UPI003261B7B7
MKKFYVLSCLIFGLSAAINAQIKQVSDLNKSGDSGIGKLAVFNGDIYFEADEGGDLSDELYRISADGSVSLFKDINQDTLDTSPSSDPSNFIEYNGKLYFNANDGDKTGHDKELWVTDGTPENTMMVMDIQEGENKGSNPQQLFVFNNKLYFQANDGSSTQWWRIDGDAAPEKITDLNGGGFATPMNPIVDEANNITYFQANNGKNELHILKADETVEIIDINPSNHGYTGGEAILFNGKLLFQGDNGTDGDELWTSDATVAGTSMLVDINVGSGNGDPAGFTILGDKVYFFADNGNGDQLFVTDGTAEGTMLLFEPNPGDDGEVDNLFAYNGKLYFSAVDTAKGEELWVFDGTDAKVLKDINTAGDSKPEGFIEVDGLLFFEATDSSGTKLWVTDGTEENTLAVASDFYVSENPDDINLGEVAVIGSNLYFTGDDANGDDIFVVNAASVLSDVKQATDFNKSGDAGIANPYVFNGNIYFEGDEGGDIGDELYRITTDGVAALFKNINQDTLDTSPNSDPSNFIEYNGKLYFNANDGDKTGHDKELWVTDGTPENTMMVMDIQEGENKGSNPQQLFVFNNKLYFQANDGSSTQWWRIDGDAAPEKITDLNGGGYATPSYPIVDEANNITYFQANNGRNELHILKADETVEIIDINPSNHGYTGNQAILFNGKLLFQGDNGTDGDELWISDGSVAGTSMLVDINVGSGNGDPAEFTVMNDKVYFVADNGTGDQLFVTDGTAEGTMLVFEPNPGEDGEVDNLYACGGKLYFSAVDSVKGEELWVFNGTNGRLLKDINTEGDAKPEGFIGIDGLVFFEAADSTGTKLWVSDGAAGNTMKVADVLNTKLDPDEVNSADFVVVGTKLYYTGDDAEGEEFFVVDAAKIEFEVQYYDVTITVVDKNNNPLGGAVVTFNGESISVNEDGVAVFSDVVSGTSADYTVSLNGYNAADGSLVVDEDLAENVMLILTSVNEALNADLRIYPNPTTGILYVDGNVNNIVYNVYDLNQRLVSNGTVQSQQIKLNLVPGMYVLQLKTDAELKVEKIIIK